MNENLTAQGLGADGLYTARPGTISTWSHGRIDPLNPTPEEVSLPDIAHALSRLCRYNGHVGGFLSVARHCVWVADRVLAETGDKKLALQGLLHDGAEAYLSDIPRPVKRAAAMAMFRYYDQKMDKAVMEAFGLPYPIPQEVMDADLFILTEIELPDPDGARWTWNSTPEADEAEFLAAYARLTGAFTKPTIIGLSGYAQSGKDTVANLLVQHAGFQQRAFADALRALLVAIDPIVEVREPSTSEGWPPVSIPQPLIPMPWSAKEAVQRYGWDYLKQTSAGDRFGVRQILQRLGTEAGRKVLGDDIWVRTAMQTLEPGVSYVFSDVRFPNEADAIKAAGGEVWRITRPGVTTANDHPSETGLDGYAFDLWLSNDGDIEQLHTRVIHALDGLRHPIGPGSRITVS